jgi:hypothetical protein
MRNAMQTGLTSTLNLGEFWYSALNGAFPKVARVIGSFAFCLAVVGCGLIDDDVAPTGELRAGAAVASASTASSDVAPDPTVATIASTSAPANRTSTSASRTSTTAAPAAPTTPTSTKINSVDEVINDMAMLNEGPLLGVNQSYGFAKGPGFVMMGNDPRLTNTPAWFDRSIPGIGLTTYWGAIIPWFVMFEGVGNTATNSRIHIRNLKMYWKSKSDGAWRVWGSMTDAGGSYCAQGGNYAGCTGGDIIKRREADGGYSVRMVPGMNFHGWWNDGLVSINGPDIAAVFVTMQHRLVVDDAARGDDRAAAKYLVHVGADYYPSATSGSFGLAANPGVGVSRSKYATSNWRAVSMLTFSDVGSQEPGGGITRAQFLASPPPLE